MKKLLIIGAVAMAMAPLVASAEDPYISTAGNHGNEGEQHFIDTAWTITAKTRVELDYALLEDWTSSWESSYLFGGSGQSPSWFTAFVQNGYIGFHNGSGWKEIRSAGVNSADVRFTAILDNANDTASLLTGGVTVGSVATAHRDTYGNATLKIASHVFGTNNFAAIKIYGIRIYEDGAMMRDYSPLVKGGVAGFRDTVTGTFLAGVALTASANTPVEEDDPYLATDGESLYVDTYWTVTPQTRFELDYALIDDYTSMDSVYLFGGSGQSPSWFTAFFRAGNDSVAAGVGFANGLDANNNANWKTGHLGELALKKDIRHTAVIDNANGWVGTLLAGVTNSYSTATSAASFQSGTIKIASHVNVQNFSAIKIYGYRIFEGGVKVHDYTPMRKGGQLGFKDSVTGAFFVDMHTVQLAAGGNMPEEQDDGYVATPVDNSAYYIDTEYQASANTCIMLDCAPLGTWVDGMSAWYLFHGWGSQPFAGYFNKNGYGVRISNGWDQGVVPLASLPANFRRTFVLDNFNHKALTLIGGVTNGVKTLSASAESLPANTATIKIAAYYNGSDNYVPMKVYGCKIFESGALVRDFVPCVKDGVAGLKDEITGLLVSYPSDKQRITANSLTAGGNVLVEADPYIQGTGANGPYIVTDYKPCATTRAEIDFEQTVIDTSVTHYPFSIHIANTFTFGVYAFTNGRYGFNCRDDSSQWTHSNMPTQTLSRVKLVLDAKNGKYIAAEAGRTNQTYTFTTARTKTSTKDLYIFSSNSDAAANRMPMKLYSFKLYEDDVLVRDYVPAVKDGVAGLQDQLPGGKFLAPATGSFTYGGVFPVEVSQSTGKISHGHTATLSASAPGATSYRWLKNGEPIDGVTSGTLTVNWRRPKNTQPDAYQAVAVYSIDGLTAESAASSVLTIENVPAGMVISVK